MKIHGIFGVCLPIHFHRQLKQTRVKKISASKRKPRGCKRCRGVLSYDLTRSISRHISDKATEADEPNTQHQQGQDSHTVLIQSRDAFEEDRVLELAGSTATVEYFA